MKRPAAPPKKLGAVLITCYPFHGKQAQILVDYQTHARLSIPGAIVNLDERDFVRLRSSGVA